VGGGGFTPGMNLTWGDIPPSTCLFGEKISGLENLITLSVTLRHLEAGLCILRCLKLIRRVISTYLKKQNLKKFNYFF
jgi:hypothetical protein